MSGIIRDCDHYHKNSTAQHNFVDAKVIKHCEWEKNDIRRFKHHFF